MTQPAHRRFPWWQAFLAGLLHAACLIAAFPPVGLWGFSLVALAPLVWLVDQQRPTRKRGVALVPGSTPTPAKGDHDAPASGSVVTHNARASGSVGAFRPALFAAIGTIPFHAEVHAWLWDVAGPGMPIMVLILALYPLVFVWLLIRLRRRWPRVPLILAAPILWTALELFRGTIAFDGYPWNFVGHPLVDWWFVASPATILGAMGVSFLAAGTGGGFAAAMTRSPMAWFARLALLTAFPSVWVTLSLIIGPPILNWGGSIRVGIVQTNLPQSNKMDWPPAQRLEDLRWFVEMTEAVAAPDARGRRPDLIVWPETMFPGGTLDEQSRRAELAAGVYWNVDFPDGTREQVPLAAISQAFLDRQMDIGIPLLVGAIARENLRYQPGNPHGDEDHLYNSVYAINEGAVIARYDKVHLTPFGEVMPYISSWPWLEKQLLGFAAAGMAFDLSASVLPRVLEVPVNVDLPVSSHGGQARPFERDDIVRVATPICFESTDAALCRRLVNLARGDRQHEAGVLIVNPTNDGWFGNSDQTREQHLQLARWRALENGVPVVRAANTGISCAIDHHGNVIARGVRRPEDPPGFRGPGARTDGILMVELPLPGGRTIYSRYGDWVGWLCLWASIPLVVAAFWPARWVAGSQIPAAKGR